MIFVRAVKGQPEWLRHILLRLIIYIMFSVPGVIGLSD